MVGGSGGGDGRGGSGVCLLDPLGRREQHSDGAGPVPDEPA